MSHQAPSDRSTRPRVRAYLFDVDDTIVDFRHSRQAGLAAVQSQFPVLQIKTLTEIDLDYLAIVNILHPRVLRGELSYAEARRERLRRLFAQHGQEASSAAIDHATSLFQESFLAARRAVPGAIPLLAALKPEAGIAVVTNNVVTEQQAKLRACGLESFIDVLIAPDTVGALKPDRRVFEAALHKLGCDATDAVMVGDSWPEDICGAHGAGIRPVWLNRYGLANPDPSIATEINSFEPLDAVLSLLRSRR